ncbi:histidine kinase [Iodobacter sp. CM08]|uniref:sensor histidine kinase n=1 Tax=Iodobacter sp. CM08 TaxID=3085902 RepID=UPI0029824F03|nr:histidine kinase [Iodobacter sp. CM08]MDW5418803.1 histidine kinase [Iodobacter sp. CM08]
MADIQNIKNQLKSVFEEFKVIFDRLAVWVIQLSWGKFIFLVIFLLVLGGALGDGLKLLVDIEDRASPPPQPHIVLKISEEKKEQIRGEIKEKVLKLEELSDVSEQKKLRLANDLTDVLDVFNLFDEMGDVVVAPAPKVSHAHIEVNDIVAVFVLMLLGIKVLMGGKKRAEALARESQKEAERESLLRQVAEAKIQMMQAQIEPHFLFNTLASVEYLIETDPPRAAAMQSSLIKYLRQVLPQIREHAASNNLGREADMVTAYLVLLKMRMEERLDFKINISEGLRSAAFPPMILQTLVENAIKHGLEPKTEGGLLIVNAEVAHQKLRITVIDNGLGFGMAKSSGTGLGLQNVRERLALLYKGQSQFLITENKPSGVCITIEVPYTLAAV